MKQRFLRMLPILFVCTIAVVVFADKKTTSVIFKLVRLEGKGPVNEVVLNAEGFSTDKSVTWKKSSNSAEDLPTLEFTESDPEELSCELMFDGFENHDNVYTKNIAPLESLIAVDQGLKRPPMVNVTMFPGTFPAFKGVVSSLNTKYTMFLEDGTPVRATVNIKFKKASSATVGSKNPCP